MFMNNININNKLALNWIQANKLVNNINIDWNLLINSINADKIIDGSITMNKLNVVMTNMINNPNEII